jgi:hypothetical protein
VDERSRRVPATDLQIGENRGHMRMVTHGYYALLARLLKANMLHRENHLNINISGGKRRPSEMVILSIIGLVLTAIQTAIALKNQLRK